MTGVQTCALPISANSYQLQTEALVDVDGTSFTAYDSGGVAREALTSVVGLDHLEGETVAVVGDGNVLPDAVVTGGKIIIGTTPYSRIHAGLRYKADFESLGININLKNAATQGRKKEISAITFTFENTRFGSTGPDFNHLYPMKQRTTEAVGQPTRMFSGIKVQSIKSLWGIDGTVVYRQTDPLPVTILGIAPEVDLGGR